MTTSTKTPRQEYDERMTAWLADLRSGEHDQISGALAGAADTEDGVMVDGYCCLGRMCDVADPSRWDDGWYAGYEGVLPPEVWRDWLHLSPTQVRIEEEGHDPQVDWPHALRTREHERTSEEHWDTIRPTCASLNDNLGLTFPQIADVVEYMGLVGAPAQEEER